MIASNSLGRLRAIYGISEVHWCSGWCSIAGRCDTPKRIQVSSILWGWCCRGSRCPDKAILLCFCLDCLCGHFALVGLLKQLTMRKIG